MEAAAAAAADRKAYAAGWRAFINGSPDALERADVRGVRTAWYLGFSDANLSDQGGFRGMSLECRSAIDSLYGSTVCECETCERLRG